MLWRTAHLPVLQYLKEKGIFVSVVNPLIMKKYTDSCTMRKGKTDRMDSRRIASYGLDNWYHLVEFDTGMKRKLIRCKANDTFLYRLCQMQAFTF